MACATCIDSTWSDATWEDSEMAEYHRIVDACARGSQQYVFEPGAREGD